MDLKKRPLGSIVEYVAKGVAHRGTLEKRNPKYARVRLNEPTDLAGKRFSVPYAYFVC